MNSLEAITKLNVLSSYETSEEKHKEYKECIHTILKYLEILEILKKHKPNFWWIKICSNVKEYNQKYIDIPALKERILTEVEFNLLKEWFEND